MKFAQVSYFANFLRLSALSSNLPLTLWNPNPGTSNGMDMILDRKSLQSMAISIPIKLSISIPSMILAAAENAIRLHSGYVRIFSASHHRSRAVHTFSWISGTKSERLSVRKAVFIIFRRTLCTVPVDWDMEPSPRRSLVLVGHFCVTMSFSPNMIVFAYSAPITRMVGLPRRCVLYILPWFSIFSW